MTDLTGVLLAAGGSRRLAQPKQLVDIDGVPLVLRQARMLCARCRDTVVVSGAKANEVEAALGRLPVRIVRNTAWASGMGASLALGAASVTGNDGVLLLLVDQWRVTSADLGRLVKTWHADDSGIVLSDWGRAAGPPAVFPASALPWLARLQGDAGARPLLESGRWPVRRVTLRNAAHDLDTAADLAAMRRYCDRKR